MTLLDPLHPLQSSILEILARGQGITMAQLHQALIKQHGIRISLQNLYRTVGQMVEKQILVREGKKLSLNFVWITHQMTFSETIRQTYLHTQTASELPDKEDDRREFSADSLMGLDPIWNDLLTRIAASGTDEGFYEYVSHPYYYLGKRETETRFYQGLTERDISCFTLHGNDSFLDRYGNKLVTLEGVQSITASDTGFPTEGYVLSLYGGLIVECVFPPVIARHFAVFFQTVQAIEQFDAELFSSIFKMRARCKLTVRKSKKDAEKLQAKIAAFFAPNKGGAES